MTMMHTAMHRPDRPTIHCHAPLGPKVRPRCARDAPEITLKQHFHRSHVYRARDAHLTGTHGSLICSSNTSRATRPRARTPAMPLARLLTGFRARSARPVPAAPPPAAPAAAPAAYISGITAGSAVAEEQAVHAPAAAPALPAALPAVLPTVLPEPQVLRMRETEPVLDAEAPVVRWRVRDARDRRRYRVVCGEAAGKGDVAVNDARGRCVWRVAAGRSERERCLRKPGSAYRILLFRKSWTSHLPKEVIGVAHYDGEASGKQVFSVAADAVGRLFRVVNDASSATLAECTRGSRIERLIDGTYDELTCWKASIESNVDTALVTAIVSVLEEWSAPAKKIVPEQAEYFRRASAEFARHRHSRDSASDSHFSSRESQGSSAREQASVAE